MNIPGLLGMCAKAGIQVTAQGNELKISAEKGTMTPEILLLLKNNKSALLSYFQDYYSTGLFVLPEVKPRGHSGPGPLSFAQQRLWFVDQLESGSVQYNSPGYFKISQRFEHDVFKRALEALIHRHQVLRTNIQLVAGEPRQIIKTEFDTEFTYSDLSALSDDEKRYQVQHLLRHELSIAFNLADDLMLRVHVAALGSSATADSGFLVLYVMHHIASDGWSKQIFSRELQALYSAFLNQQPEPLPPQLVQYADYALWQRDWLKGEVLEQQLGYWLKQLDGIAPVHHLPLDKPRPVAQSFQGRLLNQTLSQDISKQIKQQCDRQEVTLFIFMQSAFALLLARFGYNNDVVMGTPIAGRNHADLENLIGFFVNTLVLRSDVSGNPEFRGFLKANKKMILDAYAHQHLPFEMLVEKMAPDRNLSHNPLFQISFAVQNNESAPGQLAATPQANITAKTSQPEQERQHTRFDLELNVSEKKDGLSISWLYNDALFEQSTIQQLMDCYQLLLQQILESLSGEIKPTGIAELVLATEPQSGGEADNTTSEPVLIHQLFEQQVAQTPDKIAIVCDEQRISYKELNQQANSLAHLLIEQGLAPGSVVGVLSERSIEFVVGILAVLKAGYCYLALDPETPKKRLSFMLDDSGVELILSKVGLSKLRSGINKTFIDIDGGLLSPAYKNISPVLTQGQLNGRGAAYLIYTSGSTGNPKGVLGTHLSIVNRIRWMQKSYPDEQHEVYCQKTSLNFVDHVAETFQALTSGFPMVILSNEQVQDTHQFVAALAKHSVTRLTMVPSLLNELLAIASAADLPMLKQIISSGECLLQETLQRFHRRLPACRLLNLYGSSEVGADVTCAEFSRDSGSEPRIIGKAISNTRTYVVNELLSLQPQGAIGQLCIAGDGLALGYLNNPQLSEKQFIQNPFETDSKLFLTGDLVRVMPDGQLLYLGRCDDQLKIRGARVEPAEIQYQLTRLDCIEQAVVMGNSSATGETRLVAWIVAADFNKSISHLDQTVPEDIALLKEKKSQYTGLILEQLKDRLTSFMIPRVFVFMESMPLTSSGKVDKKSLPPPSDSELSGQQYVAPRNETETLLQALWQATLKLPKVGINDNFFQIGGHSLLATRLISAVRQTFQVELPLKVLFESPTIAALSGCLNRNIEGFVIPPMQRADRRSGVQLSYAQQRLWFIDKLSGGSAQFNMTGTLTFNGHCDVEALKKAVRCLIERHEVLRTRFVEMHGEPVQVVEQEYQLPFSFYDFSTLCLDDKRRQINQLYEQATQTAFNLSAELMLRVSLIKFTDDNFGLIYTQHHIASDGWSIGIFQNELHQLYQAFCRGEDNQLQALKFQYADFADWQRGWLQGELLAQQLGYWEQRLAGIPPVHKLPLDKPRPEQQSFAGALIHTVLDVSVSRRLKAQCQRQEVTLFMFLQTAFAVLLGRYSNEHDIVIGSPIAGRPHKDLENMIGFFVNSLALRVDLSGQPTFETLLKENKQNILDAFAHQHIPFEMLVEKLRPERNLNHNPLFQVSFAVQNNERGVLDLTTHKHNTYRNKGDKHQSPFSALKTNIRNDLELHTIEVKEDISFVWLYNTSLFEHSTVERMSKNFNVLINSILDALESQSESVVTIDQLDMLHSAEKTLLLETWNNNTASYPTDAVIQQLFEHQVVQQPQATALVYQNTTLTYQQVNDAANQLAHYLVALGISIDEPVLLCTDRSAEMVIAILAILKAGGAYVPIDPAHPPGRIEFIAADCGCRFLLTQTELIKDIVLETVERINLDEAAPAIQTQSKDNLTQITETLSGKNLAYIIYTSGTTGQPKGAMIEHHSVVNLGCNLAQLITDKMAVRQVIWALNAGYFFDASVQAISQLCTGARIVVIPQYIRQSPEKLRLFLKDNDINVLDCTPAQLRLLLADADSFVPPTLVIGGEKIGATLWADLVRLHTEKGVISVNVYGPTEACVDSTIAFIDAQTPTEKLGYPLANVTAYVMVEDKPAPIGVVGELWIGGAGVGRGYRNRAGLTAEKFVTYRFENGISARLYKTGDLVRYQQDGQLEFVGRKDEQVKIRGFRLELGEVEATLSAMKSVSSAAVVVNAKPKQENQLVAYICPDRDYLDAKALQSNRDNLLRWTDVFDEQYSVHEPSGSDAGTNFIGWNSSYQGGQIVDEQMTEWLDNTVACIEKLKPSRLLEVGCGTGLLLFRYASWCQHVLALDISQTVLNEVQKQVDARQLSHVILAKGDALATAPLAGKTFDTIVVNSVAQYFPNSLYLEDVIEHLLAHLDEGGKLLFGDVRNLDLHSAHVCAIEHSRLSQSTSADVLINRVQRRLQQEPELLISPSFFVGLQKRHPAIGRVDILVKRSRYDNEMSRYRYEAIITKQTTAAPQAMESAITWEEFTSELRVHELISSGIYETFGISRYPNARVAEDVALSTGLSQWQGASLIYPQEHRGCLSAEAMVAVNALEDLLQYAESQGYTSAITWCQDGLDKYDILFSRGMLPEVQASAAYNQQYQINYPQLESLVQSMTAELTGQLRQALPDYMIPSLYIPMPYLPMTSNGKVDKRALPSPIDEDFNKADYLAAQTPDQAILCQLWQELLNIKKVGIEDNFFALGGHSLLATRLISAIRQKFEVELPLAAIFEFPTIRDLAKKLRAGSDLFVLPAILPVQRNRKLPTSFAQQRLWFIDQLGQGSAEYNMSGGFPVKGAFNLVAMEQALNALVARHEVLRTHFELFNFEPVQVIKKDVHFNLPFTDLSQMTVQSQRAEITHRFRQQKNAVFDLSQDLMLRAQVLKLGEKHHILLYTLHHIASDGWSMSIFNRELSALYNGFHLNKAVQLPELGLQYADYAVWQRQWLTGDLLVQQLSFWKTRLAGLPAVHNLPMDKPRPARPSYAASSFQYRLDSKLSAALNKLCGNLAATPFIVLQSCFAALISRYSREKDIVMGSPVAGRSHKDVEGLIGFFVNTLVLRTDLSGDPTFRELVAANKTDILQAFAHQHVPFEMLVEEVHPERHLNHNPLFQIMFAVQNNEQSVMEMSEADCSYVATGARPADSSGLLHMTNRTTRFDMELNVAETQNGANATQFCFEWIYNNALFEDRTIEQMIGSFTLMLERFIADPECSLSHVAIVSEPDQISLLTQWNDTKADYARDACLHELFEQQVVIRGDAVALEFNGQTLTYNELNHKANQVAQYLLEHHQMGSDKLVGLCVERSLDMVIAIIGILKAGGAYVPLDPAYPETRLKFILDDTGLDTVLTWKKLLAVVPVEPHQAVCLDDESLQAKLATYPAKCNPSRMAQALSRDLAYVMYTSGSTGTPKGVMIEQRSVAALALDKRFSTLDCNSVIGQASNMSFDALTYELWGALLNGGKLVHVPKEVLIDAPQLQQHLIHHQIDSMFFTSSLFNVIANNRPSLFQTMKQVYIGGEECSADAVRKVQNAGVTCQLVNSYGPTESTTFSVFKVITAQELATLQKVPIGIPLSNTSCLVLDENLKLVPLGVEGELYLGGDRLARGYLNRPALTAERFIDNPYYDETVANSHPRLYKTGDIVKRLYNGELEFVGRVDHQVKLRGFRIELGEVESHLLALNHVKEACVIIRNDQNDNQQDRQMVAYVVAAQDAKPAQQEYSEFKQSLTASLASALAGQLPAYMLPSVILLLDAMPLTANGKLNRQALPAPDDLDLQKSSYVAPRNIIEEKLCQLWQDALGLEKVGIFDNFFELGGHSLLATRLISGIRETFSIELPISVLFESPSLVSLSEHIRTERNEFVLPPIKLADRSQLLPLSFAQQRIWFIDQLVVDSSPYNVFSNFMLHGEFNQTAFSQALRSLIDRHEVLRTLIASEGGEARLLVQHEYQLPYAWQDLTPLTGSDKEQKVQELKYLETTTPFDLSSELMIRVQALQLSPRHTMVLHTTHHIASDGWSVAILEKELKALYADYCAGKRSSLPDLRIQYVDYAVWQRHWLQGEVLAKQLDYWMQQLKDIPSVHRLPLDKARPPFQASAGKRFQQVIDGSLTAKIRALCEENGVTLFIFLQTAFAVLIARYSQQDDVVIGSPVSGRTHRDVEDLIGFFVNSLVLRTDLAADPSFIRLLGASKQNLMDAYTHQHLPFETLVEKLSPARHVNYNPIFQIVFSLQNKDHTEGYSVEESVSLGGRSQKASEQYDEQPKDRSTRFDLELSVKEEGEILVQSWVYNTSLFDVSTATLIARSYNALLHSIVDDLLTAKAAGSVKKLGMLSRRDLDTLQTFSATAVNNQQIDPELIQLLKNRAYHLSHGSPVMVLDNCGLPQPAGVTGELYLSANPCTAEMAAARQFKTLTTDPFSGLACDGLIATGDLVRWSSTGYLTLVSSVEEQQQRQQLQAKFNDLQVLLSTHEWVSEAVVVTEPESQQGIAFIVLKDVDDGMLDKNLAVDHCQVAKMLSQYVRHQQTRYLVPAGYYLVESIPRTKRGDVDEAQLMAQHRSVVEHYEAPRNETEVRLSKLWQDILGKDKVGIQDDFFALGGHSLLATRLISAIRAEFAVELPISALFEAPKLRDLSEKILTSDQGRVMPAIVARAAEMDEIDF